MPYIAQEERERASEHPRTPGELNYAITLRLIRAWEANASPLGLNVLHRDARYLFHEYWNEKMQNYTTINDIYGATACALLEFRRRVRPRPFSAMQLAQRMIARALSVVVDEFYNEVVVDFERQKCSLNGDMYSMPETI